MTRRRADAGPDEAALGLDDAFDDDAFGDERYSPLSAGEPGAPLPQGKLELFAAREHAGQRLDAFVAACVPALSRSRVKSLIEAGRVTAQGRAQKAAHKLSAGDDVVVDVPPPAPATAEPEELPLRIVFEDAHLLVVDKAAGMVVHPAAGVTHGTLVNAVLFHCRDLQGIGGTLRPGIVHRIDKGTTGLLVVAKSDAAYAGLAPQFKAHSIARRYLALVHGAPTPPSATVETLYGRDPHHRTRFSSRVKSGRSAITHYAVQENLLGMSLLSLRLQTGRTHQIRVHMADRGHPVIGDPTYGRALSGQRFPVALVQAVRALDRQMLHAAELGFAHPISGAALHFTAPLPADFAAILALARAEQPAPRPSS